MFTRASLLGIRRKRAATAATRCRLVVCNKLIQYCYNDIMFSGLTFYKQDGKRFVVLLRYFRYYVVLQQVSEHNVVQYIIITL